MKEKTLSYTFRPITFILFSASLQAIVAAHGLQCIVYADDTQLFITFPPEDRARESALRKMKPVLQTYDHGANRTCWF